MKRTERHHLKENDLEALARQARETLEGRRRETTVALAAAVILGAALLGYVAWQDRVESRAAALLAEGLTTADTRVGPPSPDAGPSFATERARAEAALVKYKAAADAYPDTDAGLFARYRQAGTELELGNTAQAAAAYQQVVDRAGDGIFGQMARVGLAETQARSGQYEPAIATLRELAQQAEGPMPVDGILMRLGLVYRDAGQAADARQTFDRIVKEFPASPFTALAQRELDQLNKTT